MNRFFATFPSGAQAIVGEILKERLKDLRVNALLDGAADFETAVPYSDLNLFCMNNVFRVIHQAQLPTDGRELDAYLALLLNSQFDWAPVRENAGKIKSFRLVTSRQNRLTAVDKSLRVRLESKIARVSGLRVDRSRPDTEFWLLSRSEGTCYFLKRLSRHTAYDKVLEPGRLHPELAYLMCWLSRPKHTDTVLDPFCGYGSIPLERCRRFPFSRLYAFDNDPRPLARTRENLGKKRDSVVVERQDALALSRVLPPNSVDAVITDPPWGLYRETELSLPEFYRQMLEQVDFVLKPGGKLVLLTAAGEELLQAVQAVPRLALQQEYRILVSGKKCGLFVLERAIS